MKAKEFCDKLPMSLERHKNGEQRYLITPSQLDEYAQQAAVEFSIWNSINGYEHESQFKDYHEKRFIEWYTNHQNQER